MARSFDGCITPRHIIITSHIIHPKLKRDKPRVLAVFHRNVKIRSGKKKVNQEGEEEGKGEGKEEEEEEGEGTGSISRWVRI